jgi:hypothetical protein
MQYAKSARNMDCSVSCTGLLLIPPCVRFLFPSAFLIDVLLRASRAQSLLVSDCTAYRDYPLSCFISETLSLTEDAPHHLIVSLPLLRADFTYCMSSYS